jgi:hypothetical protein
LWAFSRGPDARTKAHGFQAIVLGTIWPICLYVGSAITPGATQIIFVMFAFIWIGAILLTASGRGVVVPGLQERIARSEATDEA